MKIAIVTNKIYSIGGVQVFSRDLSNFLGERGHEVSIIGEESIPKKPKKDLEKAVGEYFNKLNKENHYDVVICNGEFGYSVEHKKAINVFHGGYYQFAMALKDFDAENVTKERLTKAGLQKISAEGKYVVTVSKYSAEGLEESGINVDKIINNTADTNIFHQMDVKNTNSTIALSRGVGYRKGFDVLKELADRGVKMKLFSDVSIESSNVENSGFIDNKKLNIEYNRASLLLSPSRFEGGSLTVIEAMACGCPVLTTPTGNGPEIKKIISNFVADPNSINEVLAKYEILTNDRKTYSKLALDYFWAYHSPETFKKEWISLVEGI